jgi:hypothetical protein
MHCGALLPAVAGPASAQPGITPATPDPSATIKATVDKERSLSANPSGSMLEVTVTDNTPLVWPASTHCRISNGWKRERRHHRSPGQRYYRQSLTVTSFDSGIWAIPRLPFLVPATNYFSDSIRIAVGYTKIDSNKGLHDIKDIIDIPNPFARWFGWIVAATYPISLTLVFLAHPEKEMVEKTGGDLPATPAVSL